MKKNILAIGNTAAKICEKLKRYDLYEVYEISNEISRSSKRKFKLDVDLDAEKYEEAFRPQDVKFLDGIKNYVQVFVCGASQSSGITLKLMEELSNRQVAIDVVYFTPEVDFLSESQVLQERLCRNILQQYARSGAIQEIILISNKGLEAVTGTPNVFEYYENINKAFSETFYMIDVFKRSDPVLSTFSKKSSTSRIKTMGISNLSCENMLFFPLKNQNEVYYYFGINEDSLRNDEAFFSNLREKLKNNLSDSKKIYFGIYATKYEHDYVYVESYSSKIQELALDKE